mmetsp:Transcript_41293/g.79129  ORF Transcript_41293/g.79129 Transcript_41293/m.79129 type:complete len:87 (+) Transcript_41293:114-374(+)
MAMMTMLSARKRQKPSAIIVQVASGMSKRLSDSHASSSGTSAPRADHELLIDRGLLGDDRSFRCLRLRRMPQQHQRYGGCKPANNR